MTDKTISRIYPAQRDDIGDLLTQRPLPNEYVSQIDPFLFLNHHGPQTYPPHNHGLPFGPHPHRGFETVTFMFDGELAHRDSAGHESVIGAGGVQWMTAGSGIVHAEVSPALFMEQGGPLEIIQLWVNLPGRLKMTAPAYQGLQGEQIPAIALDGGKVELNLIAGQWPPQGNDEEMPASDAGQAGDARHGPVASLTGVFMSTIRMQQGGRIRLPGLLARHVLLYVVRGAVQLGGDRVGAFHLAELGSEGDAIELLAETDSMVLFGHAEPLNEPVVAHGPFVMNTREQIQTAIDDYQTGRFGAPLPG